MIQIQKQTNILHQEIKETILCNNSNSRFNIRRYLDGPVQGHRRFDRPARLHALVKLQTELSGRKGKTIKLIDDPLLCQDDPLLLAQVFQSGNILLHQP